MSRYAWGADYHEVIRRRLHKLADFHRRLVPAAGVRGVVDTAPLLERQFGQLAGLGWIGKNTMLINERFGSWLFLAALLSTEEIGVRSSRARPTVAARAARVSMPVLPAHWSSRTASMRGSASATSRSSCAARFRRSFGRRAAIGSSAATPAKRRALGIAARRRPRNRRSNPARA